MRKRTEFFKITKDILVHNEFDKLKNVSHHGISRHNHSMRVAYYTYLVTKTLHLNYKGQLEVHFFMISLLMR